MRDLAPKAKRVRWPSWSLYSQLVLTISVLVALIVFSLSYLTIQRQLETNRVEIRRSSVSRLETLVAASIDAMYLTDVDTLDNVADRMVDSGGLVAVVFFDTNGRVISISGEHPLQAYLGLLDVPPIGLSLLDKPDTYFTELENSILVGERIQVGRQIIGAVLVESSTLEFHRSLAEIQSQSIVLGLAALAIGILVALLLSRVLVHPLAELANVTQRIAAGKLDDKIQLNSSSTEIEQLASSMEFMRLELSKLYNNLEMQVQTRTEELAKANSSLEINNRELLNAQKIAEEANRLKSEFLATMSHELRTPLNAILGFSGLLVMGVYGKLEDSAIEKVRVIENSGKHLLALINDVLDISKIEAGRMKIFLESVNIAAILETVVSRMSILASDKGLKFSFTIDPDFPKELVTDSERITQITTNLISNAIKFTDTGEVSLRVQRKASDSNLWQIHVRDTGIGIPPEAQEYIFDEFRQVDASYTRTFGGTGLGLAIVRKLALALNGNVEVESELGKGSHFIVTLPLQSQVLAMREEQEA